MKLSRTFYILDVWVCKVITNFVCFLENETIGSKRLKKKQAIVSFISYYLPTLWTMPLFSSSSSSSSTATRSTDLSNNNNIALGSSSAEDRISTVDLGDYYQAYSHCHSFQYQRDLLYRFGHADNCQKPWKDLVTAMEAQFRTTDPQKRRALIESTHLYQRRQQEATGSVPSPTIGVIWDAKDPPKWD